MPGPNCGDVPAWLGSVLTGGSLLLGFSIVKQDRKNREREQVAQIAFLVKTKAKMRHESLQIAIQVLNASELPVQDTEVQVTQQMWFFAEREYVAAKCTLLFDFGRVGPKETKKLWQLLDPWPREPDGSFQRKPFDWKALEKEKRVSWSAIKDGSSGETISSIGAMLLDYHIDSLPNRDTADTTSSHPDIEDRYSQISSIMQRYSHSHAVRYGKVDIGYAPPTMMRMSLADNAGRFWDVIPGQQPMRQHTTRWRFLRLKRRQ